ncbi:hypothetical protein [Phaffia rhodozyma]|uniref:Uncharacterized protein n=1 Tax=Phaffia rhodozyma TaxID=264483 RepID=A0A0F7SNI2_PHARH|nr:hypothetical protein [Phaffia rhodozyma]
MRDEVPREVPRAEGICRSSVRTDGRIGLYWPCVGLGLNSRTTTKCCPLPFYSASFFRFFKVQERFNNALSTRCLSFFVLSPLDVFALSFTKPLRQPQL